MMNTPLLRPPDIKFGIKETRDSYVLRIERESYVPDRRIGFHIPWVMVICAAVLLAALIYIFGTGALSSSSSIPSPHDNEGLNFFEEVSPDKSTTQSASDLSVLWTKSGFLFSDSDERYLDEDDLFLLTQINGFTEAELIRYSVNEIYARHHYLFETEKYYEFYSGYDWYSGHLNSEDACASFNAIEHKNIAFLLRAEEQYK